MFWIFILIREEVAKSDIYLGLIGREYGFEDAVGVSPTEREYDCAGEHNKPRFVFVKKLDVRTPKEQRFFGEGRIRKGTQDIPQPEELEGSRGGDLGPLP